MLKLFELVSSQEMGTEAVPSLSWGSRVLEDADCLNPVEATPYAQSTEDEGNRELGRFLKDFPSMAKLKL